VVHPKVIIIAEAGPIIIGQNNILEEQVVIKNCYDTTEGSERKPKIMRIGSSNVFEVGSYIASSEVGNRNIIEPKAQLGINTTIGDNCIIGTKVQIPPGQKIADKTVVWGSMNNVQVQEKVKENYLAIHNKHLEILWKTLPNFHHLQQPSPQ